MPTTTLSIDGEVTANWDTTTGANHWDEINEDPDSPTDGTYIETITLTDDDRFTFSSSPGNTNLVTQIDLDVRCGITDASNASYIACSLYHSTSTQIGTTLNITAVTSAPGTTEVLNDGTLKKCTLSWSGLSLTKTQIDSLEVKFVFNNV